MRKTGQTGNRFIKFSKLLKIIMKIHKNLLGQMEQSQELGHGLMPIGLEVV